MQFLGATPSDAADLVTKGYADSVPGARVFVQVDDPDTTNPAYTGPAVWFVLNGSGQVIGKKVRA